MKKGVKKKKRLAHTSSVQLEYTRSRTGPHAEQVFLCSRAKKDVKYAMCVWGVIHMRVGEMEEKDEDE